jgi:hypothetical protein
MAKKKKKNTVQFTENYPKDKMPKMPFNSRKLMILSAASLLVILLYNILNIYK